MYSEKDCSIQILEVAIVTIEQTSLLSYRILSCLVRAKTRIKLNNTNGYGRIKNVTQSIKHYSPLILILSKQNPRNSRLISLCQSKPKLLPHFSRHFVGYGTRRNMPPHTRKRMHRIPSTGLSDANFNNKQTMYYVVFLTGIFRQ